MTTRYYRFRLLYAIMLTFIFGVYSTGFSQYNTKEGTRQVHLDFHTSEMMENVGHEFSKTQFQQALKLGKVNSINVFAKGHHGWCYYDTKIGERHPNLKFDLLQSQIDACHEAGVRVQAYFTVGWSAKDAREHPEWIIKSKEGEAFNFGGKITPEIAKGEAPLPFYTWDALSPEGEYLDLILAHVRELVDNYDLDGYFFDIIPIQYYNYNQLSVEDMIANGVDTDNEVEVEKYHIQKMEKFLSETRKIILSKNPDASIFYNWTTHFSIEQSLDYGLEKYNTKFDLEDLPTTWDGYDLFPLRMKYYANLGKECVAMSGKFHTAWGEFGGFKHKDAILYEAASMVAFGANVNFGDQLHPAGMMDMGTYENIGYAYDYIEKIEDYGIGAKHEAAVAVWFANSKESDEGVVKILLENQVNFVVANTSQDWSKIKVLIIPDAANLIPADIERIQVFIDNGGKLLVLGRGALNGSKDAFVFDLGVEYLGDSYFDVDYTIVDKQVSQDLISSPFLNYEPSIRVKPLQGTEVLASIREPYFNRRINAYSSHQNTPYKLYNADYPAITKKGNIIFIAGALGKSYFKMGARVHRQLFINCLNLLNNNPMLKVDLPSSGRANLLHQIEKNRYVVHLTYGTPHQRGRAQVIEDLVPLYNTPVSVDFDKTIKRAYTVPSMNTVELKEKNGRWEFILPKFAIHSAIVFEY